MAKQGEDLESDDGIEALLREVGARDLPAPELMQKVRDAVHVEWRQMVEQRARRRRFTGLAIAASVAGIALAVAFTTLMLPRSVVLAQVARVSGSLQIDTAGAGEWRPIVAGEQVKTGDIIRTDAGSSAALKLADGVSVRVAAGSLLELAAADRIALERGGLYVDAGKEHGSQDTLLVQTPFGSVRHLGTQYQVLTARDGIAVSVREGRVEIANTFGTHTAVAGEQVQVQSPDQVIRSQISPQDASWQWAVQIAPAMTIENQPLSGFLDWVARETGRQVVYASDAAHSQAQALILRGSVGELTPEQALEAVLATTSFTHRESGDVIEITHY